MIDITAHNFLQSFLVGLINRARLAGSLQPVDDQLNAEIGGLVLAPFLKVIDIVGDGLQDTLCWLVLCLFAGGFIVP